MDPAPSYTRNAELFARFYVLQRDFTGHLAAHPDLVRLWLGARPGPAAGEGSCAEGKSKSWRTSRLSVPRRRQLAALLDCAEGPAADRAPLAAWLLARVPVGTYLEIAQSARPEQIECEARRCHGELVDLRETLLVANYGLALSAARARRYPDYDDRLSAAACGLLDAIDRYVPGEKAARFGYFASYWIRYHLSRQAQKEGSLVSFPIHQQRISRKIFRYVSECCEDGGPPPSQAQIRSRLQLGADAWYWHRRRPEMVSLQAPANPSPDAGTIEQMLGDPCPGPAEALDEADALRGLNAMVRAGAAPATRIMLAYTRGLGLLAEAAQDYLAELHGQVRARLSAAPAAALGT